MVEQYGKKKDHSNTAVRFPTICMTRFIGSKMKDIAEKE
jgi:hypothetical protein